jgi:hypothetical protein
VTLPLELGGIQDPFIRRAFENVSQQFPVLPRYSWGLVKGSDGSKLAGSGDFTPSRSGVGTYAITWTLAKKGTAYMVLLSVNGSGAGTLQANYVTKAAGSVGVNVFASTTGVNADPTDWSFLVFDPQ